jgi:dTDP-4-amino-4,6-dideoxygalactose transaminase
MILATELVKNTYFRGRVALYAVLRGLGIGKDNDVVLQAFTCIAVPEAIMAAGARPRYIDIEATGFNMDATDLKRKLTPKTRAIVVQHTYGIPADMDRLLQVAREAGLPIIEDCCHTLASTYHGKTTGSFGVASFYSYEWGKPIVAGIGGSAVINDPELRDRVRESYENYRSPGAMSQVRIQLQYYAFRLLYRPAFYWPVRSVFHRLGSLGVAESNYNPVGEGNIAEDFSLRMAPALQRRLARKLMALDQQTRHSRWVAGEYQARIRSAVVSHPALPEGSDTVFARYPLLAKDKPALLAAARKANVEVSEWYSTPVHPLSGEELRLVHYEPGSCPNAEALCKEVVTLPTHPATSKRDVDRTVGFLNEAGRL